MIAENVSLFTECHNMVIEGSSVAVKVAIVVINHACVFAEPL